MRKVIYGAGMFIMSCALFSSWRPVYAPNAHNVPLFQEKGELKATVATNNVQIATPVTEHIGVTANGYLKRYTSDEKIFKNNGKRAEIGIGYFGHTEKRITYVSLCRSGILQC